MKTFTPMIEQYLKIKKEYADCILLFRLGDFYEMFFSDAEKASMTLDIVLTARDSGQEKIPMCGVPYHAAGNYIKKLLDKGFKVAICDQVEDPKDAKGIVKREVTRVITPGTVIDDGWLNKDNNYLSAVVIEENKAGLAYIDISTGEFAACQFNGTGYLGQLQDELARIRPTECLIPKWNRDVFKFETDRLVLTELVPELFTLEAACFNLASQFGQEFFKSLDPKESREAVIAAGAIISFVNSTLKAEMKHIKKIQTYQVNDFMGIDKTSRRNLELVANQRDGGTEGSLLSVLDHTCTPMGLRLLRSWIERPLIDLNMINERLDAVEELLIRRDIREELQSILNKIRDMERIVARIGAQTVNPRELLALKAGLDLVPVIKIIGKELKSKLLAQGISELKEMKAIRDIIAKAIDDNAPVSIRDGGIIKDGFDQRVDELRKLAYNADQWLIDYEREEKEHTGIKSLKIGYNKVYGYYLEITKSNLEQVPPYYIRKQTLVNGERYITDKLKMFEDEILASKDKLLRREQELYNEIKASLIDSIKDIQNVASQLAQLDVLAALAQAAFLYDYCRPQVAADGSITIKSGRHPVVERMLVDNRFVPNDIVLNPDDARIAIVTGPNMGGKSTFLRQTALIVLMAQMGSFVPANEAMISLVDRIFTRVGASDDIASGQSTFMVEMMEVANILRFCTPKSLVLLDEVGRGTSTFDGMSIAQAVIEHLSSLEGIRVLFATHYHELTDLAQMHPAIFNLCVSVKEIGEEVVFLKKVLLGKADRSYGIHVAALAGLPSEVTQRAFEILRNLEATKSITPPQQAVQMCLFEEENNPVLEEVKNIDLNRITPLEAINLIQRWQEKLSKI